MYKRIIYEGWTDWAPILAFGFTLAFFLLVAWRGVRLRKDKAERMAALPLEDDDDFKP